MKMKNKKSLLLVIILALGAAGFFTYKNFHSKTGDTQNGPKYVPQARDSIDKQYTLINVPFTSQAPLGHWEDPRQQDGCEEASILMAWLWIKNKTMTPQEAEKAITDTSDFEQARYGNFHDFNAEDTQKLMKDYYGYTNTSVRINPSIDDMKSQLRQDKILLIPTNGQKLHNPHYQQPGPTTHMLVVKGFDESKQQFITNDPGTRSGESYIYNYQTVYGAMVDYPSGNHGPQEGRPKAMIIVSK
jgi:hypothetical protein